MIRRAPLLSFFALAFGITWVLQGAFVLSGLPLTSPPALLLLTLAGLGPSLAAVAIGARLGGRTQVRSLWGPPGWSRGPWWLVAVLARPVLALAAAGWCLALGGSAPAPAFSLMMLAGMLVASFGEELGWRGFAYGRLVDRLEQRTGRLGVVWANLVLGLAWALWHLPTAFFPGAGGLAEFGPYLVAVVSFSVIVGWVFERAGRRTMVAVLAHMGVHLGALLRPAGDLGILVETSLMIVAATLILSWWALASGRTWVGSESVGR